MYVYNKCIYKITKKKEFGIDMKFIKTTIDAKNGRSTETI